MDAYNCAPRSRKTRRDVLTAAEAVKAGKSSKSHKLAPRSVKRDGTKSREAKQMSRDRRAQRIATSKKIT
jgi:hypothetical protein